MERHLHNDKQKHKTSALTLGWNYIHCNICIVNSFQCLHPLGPKLRGKYICMYVNIL